MRQKAQKSARPRDNISARGRGRTGVRSDLRPLRRQPKKSPCSTGDAAFEDHLSRRARLREQRYDEQRRRQWVLAIALVVVLVILVTVARCNTS